MTNSYSLPALPEGLLSVDGPLWRNIIKWSDADSGASAYQYGIAIEEAVVSAMQAYAREAIRAAPEAGASADKDFVPHSYGGRSAAFYSEHNHNPNGQEAFSAGMRAGRGLFRPQPDQSARIAELGHELRLAHAQIKGLESLRKIDRDTIDKTQELFEAAIAQRDDLSAQLAVAEQRGAERMRQDCVKRAHAMYDDLLRMPALYPERRVLRFLAAELAELPTSPAPAKDNPENQS